jgi:hypothetical protein
MKDVDSVLDDVQLNDSLDRGVPVCDAIDDISRQTCGASGKLHSRNARA